MTSSANYFPGEKDTIVSQSTPAGSSCRAVIRFSGPEALRIVARLFKRSGAGGSKPDEFSNVSTYLSLSGTVCVSESMELPAKLYIMKAPFSYTRQDVAELHVPGSAPLASLIIQKALSEGGRLALAGEFTFRAFVNGRIDLTQAEAVIDVINARTVD